MSRSHPLLAALTLVLVHGLGACYAPDVLDCTVTCTAPTDCAGDQVCGSDGFCADESVAGTCDDPGVSPRVMLTVLVDGAGRIRVRDIGDCDSGDDDRGSCTWQVPRAPVQVEAIATEDEFDRWTTMVCSGQSTSCTFTPAAATMVGARFR